MVLPLEDVSCLDQSVRLAVDGFPCLDEAQHLQWLRECVGGTGFYPEGPGDGGWSDGNYKRTGRIDFLGVHPQYRKTKIAQAFLRKAFSLEEKELPVTTFREGDRADTGHRDGLKRLGFAKETAGGIRLQTRGLSAEREAGGWEA